MLLLSARCLTTEFHYCFVRANMEFVELLSVTGKFSTSSHLALFTVEGCPQQVLQLQIILENWSTTCWSSSVFLAGIYFSRHKALLAFPVSCLHTWLKFYLLKNCIITAFFVKHIKLILTIAKDVSAQCTASLTFLHCNFTFTVKYQQHKAWFPFAPCKLNFVLTSVFQEQTDTWFLSVRDQICILRL